MAEAGKEQDAVEALARLSQQPPEERRLTNLQMAAAYTLLTLTTPGDPVDSASAPGRAAALAAALSIVTARGEAGPPPSALQLVTFLSLSWGVPLSPPAALRAGQLGPPGGGPEAPGPNHHGEA